MSWHSTSGVARWSVGLCGAGLGAALGIVGCGETTDRDFTEFPVFPGDDAGPTPMPGGDSGPLGPPPQFGATVSQAKSPPPLSGGTLLLAADDKTAIAADPDRDAIYVVDVVAGTRLAAITLAAGDEPGRAVEDAGRRVHVLTRRGGAIVSIDLATNTEIGRRQVCAAPRGIAYDAAKDALHVACAGGELVTLPAAGGAPTRTVDLGPDLRDVLVVAGKLWVSRFRSAHLLQLADDGTVASDISPRPRQTKPQGDVSSSVAWRMIRIGDDPAIVHQEAQDTPIGTGSGGYGGMAGFPCGGILRSAITTINGTTPSEVNPLAIAVLPVDLAYDAKTDRVAVVAAGNARTPNLPTVLVYERTRLNGFCAEPIAAHTNVGEATSIAFRADGSLIVQSREPALLTVGGEGKTIALSDVSVADTGFAVFHANSGNNIACASCHPEGGDDARTWSFEGIGPRRTQTFRGGLSGSEPFHWNGDMKDLQTLMTHVFEGRMSGPHLDGLQLGALRTWIDHIPQIPKSTPKDLEAVARGKAIFTSAGAECATCHAGPRLTNHKTVDVGTGVALQVPSLVGVAFRAPFLHTGCAKTLKDRFGTCGGGDQHGKTAQLAPAQIDDLLAYLQSL